MSADNHDKEPVAGLSAASSCISLSLCLDENSPSFFPVYTHQCFPEEYIQGWRPYTRAEQNSLQVYRRWRNNGDQDPNETSSAVENHSSYKYVDNQDNRISVNVLLSPSCQKCKIEAVVSYTDKKEMKPNQPTNSAEEPAAKKIKRVTFEDTGIKSTQQVSVEDIIKKIQPSLPPIEECKLVCCSNDYAQINEKQSTSDLNFLPQPIGVVVKRYSRKIKRNDGTGEDRQFIITLAKGSGGSDPSVSSYHNSVQPLARWFIETADEVNISKEDGGFWSVLYLFREHSIMSSGDGSTCQFSLAGYVTLFHFHSPFRKPQAGIIVRICQALIIPTYQRAGHGSQLLLAVYEYADRYLNDYATSSTGADIVEVNVEDPAPGFVALRDRVDYKRFVSLLDSMANKNENLDSTKHLKNCPVTCKEYFQPAPDGGLSLSTLLKITIRQAEVIIEIYKLDAVEKWKESSNDHAKIEQIETYYRLMVKKSLRMFRIEELGACEGGKDEQKALLAKWFDQTYNHYRKLLGLSI